MALIEAVTALTVITAATAISYEAVDPQTIRISTQTVADAATCHTLTGAAAGYFADNDVIAVSITDITPYVSAPANVLSQYTVIAGMVSGPGCLVTP